MDGGDDNGLSRSLQRGIFEFTRRGPHLGHRERPWYRLRVDQYQKAKRLSVSSSPAARSADPFHQAPPVHVRTVQGLVRTVGPTVHFLMATEAHVYAFSVAAN